MRRFRSNRRLGSGLALLALALQLLLTFGHVHGFPSASLDTRLSSAVAANDKSGSGDPARKADFDCPICVLIHMSGTSTPSVAPELPLPAAVDFVTLRPRAELALASQPQLPYKVRAPPAV
jgi:hypothetical protein